MLRGSSWSWADRIHCACFRDVSLFLLSGLCHSRQSVSETGFVIVSSKCRLELNAFKSLSTLSRLRSIVPYTSIISSVMCMLRPTTLIVSLVGFQGGARMCWSMSAFHLISSGIRGTAPAFCNPQSRSTTRCVSSISLLPTHIPLANLATTFQVQQSHVLRLGARAANKLCNLFVALATEQHLERRTCWDFVIILPAALTNHGPAHSHSLLDIPLVLQLVGPQRTCSQMIGQCIVWSTLASLSRQFQVGNCRMAPAIQHR